MYLSIHSEIIFAVFDRSLGGIKLKLPSRIEANVSNARPLIGITTSHSLLRERTLFWKGYSNLWDRRTAKHKEQGLRRNNHPCSLERRNQVRLRQISVVGERVKATSGIVANSSARYCSASVRSNWCGLA